MHMAEMNDPGTNMLRIALIQYTASENKDENLKKVPLLVEKAVEGGANLVALPECFNVRYGQEYFVDSAETIPGRSTSLLSNLAEKFKIYIIGGSVCERENEKIYNTCTVFGPTGKLIGKYRKMHLADIDVPNQISSQESAIFTPGDSLFMFDTEWCKIGVGICYDLRIPEMATVYSQGGCKVLFYPSAYNIITGPAHMGVMLRTRAVNNQVFTAAIVPARDNRASYVTWGNTMLVDAWGDVIARCGEEDEILFGNIDLCVVEEVRTQIPILNQKRCDVYRSECGVCITNQ